MIEEIHAANGLVLVFETEDFGSELETSAAYKQINTYFEPDFVSGEPNPCQFVSFPMNLVVDLETMEVLGRGTAFDNAQGVPILGTEEIIDLVNAANN